ncbi:MAG TPA: DNA replication complex GINS family protein, partial [Thermoplasmatales archaeon]|nr:DNA replication complex GINS family protein [Thermoplasmatales archaeon]
MVDDDFTYKDLRRLHQLEKRSSAVVQVRNDFYEKVLGYIMELERLLGEVDSHEKRKLVEDELKNAKQAFKEIYELREKKIVLAALSKVRGGNPDLKNLIHEETLLFEMVVDALKTVRESTLTGKKMEKTFSQTCEEKVVKGEKVGEGDDEKHHWESEEESGEERTVVLIKKDLPTFIGVDMKKYSLRENDVV